MTEKEVRSVIVLGKGLNAIRATKWFMDRAEYNLLMVVPNQPHPTWEESFLEWVQTKGLPMVETGHYKDIPQLSDKKWRPDLVVSLNYNRIIKEWFIKRCKRIINMHNSPLPKYRGVSPVNWALKNGEKVHGVTIHEITPGIDDGAIIAQVTFPIDPEIDEVIDVYNCCVEKGWELFERTIPNLDQIKAIPQDNAQVTYYSLEQDELLKERRNFTREISLKKSHG